MPDDLFYCEEMSERLHLALIDAGFATNAAVQAATDVQLLAVPGIGRSALQKIRKVQSGTAFIDHPGGIRQ